jgi:hypothetical protein
MSSINFWPVLQKLKSEFVPHIKFFYIFGEKGKEVFIFTKDDQFFAFGNNTNGC